MTALRLSGLAALVLLTAIGIAQTPTKSNVEIVATFKGHAEPVYAVGLTPDGKHLVTGSFDSTLKLWDLATGKEVKTFGGATGHTKMVTTLAISPDGSLLASGGVDGTMKIWDLPVNVPFKTTPQDDPIRRVSLSPDGTKLALAAEKGRVSIVTPGDMKEIAKFDGPPSNGLSWNATGTLLVSAGADGSIAFFNLAKNETTLVGGHRGGANQAIVSPAGGVLSVGQEGQSRVWTIPVAPPKVLATASPTVASALAADGQTLVLAGSDKSVKLASIATGKDLRPLTVAPEAVTAIAINPTATLVAAGSKDGVWRLWNATDGKLGEAQFAHAGAVNALQFHPQLPQVITGGADGAITFWSLPPVAAKVAPHSSEVVAAIASPDGKKLITAAGDKIVRIFETGKMTLEKQFPGQAADVTALAASDKLPITGGSDGVIRLWNPATGKEAESIVAHAGPLSAVSVLGSMMVSSSSDKTVKAWQFPPVPAKAMPHPDQISALGLHPDGQRIVTAGADRVVRLITLADGKAKEFPGATLALTSAAVSPGGQFVAAGSADKTVYLWNVSDAKLLTKWTVPAAATAVAFSPDNSMIYVGLADGVVKAFKTADLKEAKETQSFSLGKGAVTGLVVTPKGDAIVVSCGDKSVQLISPKDGAVVKSIAGPAAGIALSRDGTKIALAGEKSVKLTTIDGKDLATWPLPAEAKGVSLSPDGSRVAVACADRLVRLYDADGSPVESFAHDGPALAVALLDGAKLASIGADKTARLWTSSLRWRRTSPAPVRAAIISSNGSSVVAAGDDGAILQLNLADGKDLASLPVGLAVKSLALSSDATKLATAGTEASVKIWNLAAKGDDRTKPTTVKLPAPTSAVAINLAGQQLAAAIGNDVVVFDVATGRELQRFKDHKAAVASLVFLPDQKTLATASKDHSVKLLSVTAAGGLEPHTGGVTSLRVSGNLLVSVGADKTIRLWDLTKKTEVKSFGPLPEPIVTADVSKDGQLLVAAVGKAVRLWNVADGKELPPLPHDGNVRTIALKGDKTRLLTSTDTMQSRLWDLATGKELQWSSFKEPVNAAFLDGTQGATIATVTDKAIVFEPILIQRVVPTDAGPTDAIVATAAGIAYTGGEDKTVKAWNASNGVMEKTAFAPLAGTIRAIAIPKSGQFLAVAGNDKVVRAFSLPDAKEIASYPVDDAVSHLQFAGTAPVLLVNAGPKAIALNATYAAGQPTPADFLKPLQIFSPARPFNDIALSVDGGTIFAPSTDKSLQLWKIASATPKNFVHPLAVDSITFHPKTPNVVATAGHDGKIRIFDLSKPGVVKEIAAHVEKDNKANPIYTLAYSPDGTMLLTASFDKSLKLFDAANGNFIREIKAYHEKDAPKGHRDEIYAAAFSPDGKQIASGSGGLERSIKIWKTDDGSFVRDLIGPDGAASHPGWIYHLRFLPDGRILSVGDAPKNRGHLALWNAGDGKQVWSETTPFGSLFGVALSPDQKTIAVGTGYRGRPQPEYNNGHLLKVSGINR